MEMGRECWGYNTLRYFIVGEMGIVTNFSFPLNQKYVFKATIKRKWIIIQGMHDEIFF